MSSIRSPGSMTTNTGLLFIVIGVSPAPPVQLIATVQPPRASGDCKIIMVLLLLFIMIQLLLVGSEEFPLISQVPLHLL